MKFANVFFILVSSLIIDAARSSNTFKSKIPVSHGRCSETPSTFIDTLNLDHKYSRRWSYADLKNQYRMYIEKHGPKETGTPSAKPTKLTDLPKPTVGIVGGGMAGLYSGLLLKSPGIDIDFKIFEADPDRIGGRIYTHRFTDEPNQYFEAGAMRLPCMKDQDPVFQLINYVNEDERVTAADKVELVDYILYRDNNYVFVNGAVNDDNTFITVKQAKENPAKLKFPLPERSKNKSANVMLQKTLQPYIDIVEENGVNHTDIMQYDQYSMRSFLTLLHNWTEAEVDYVETMTAQTRAFDGSFVEGLIDHMTFNVSHWKTIKDGMSRLPEACAKIIGKDKIIMGAKVHSITRDNTTEKLTIKYGNRSESFDAVILAVPPAVIRFIARPQWSATKENAIRSVHFEPLYKIGLRFKSRFWENSTTPSCGGQAITDLPSRWIVYPSVGLGTEGPGTLLCYSWMSDALKWLPHSAEDQKHLALRDLARIYGEETVGSQFINHTAVSWATEWPLGNAHFRPGQFSSLMNSLNESEGNIHFAGEHLSVHHAWILGAIESALSTVKKLLAVDNLSMLKPNISVPTCAM